MRHIYEIDCGRGDLYWEVYLDGECIRNLQGQNEFDLYLDILHDLGIDFVLHTLEEYDEYHLSLPPL